MKWMIPAGIIFLTAGCCQTAEVVEYRQVRVAPVTRTVAVIKRVPVIPVVTRVVTPVMEPVSVDYVEPLDVTTTTIDFY